MKNYRLQFIDKDGKLITRTMVECREDHAAIGLAEQAIRTCKYIEIWNDGTPVCICAKPPGPKVQWALARVHQLMKRFEVVIALHRSLMACVHAEPSGSQPPGPSPLGGLRLSVQLPTEDETQ
jgi:hypothetical protein